MEEKTKSNFFFAISFSWKNLQSYRISFVSFIIVSFMLSGINLGVVRCIQDAISVVANKNFSLVRIIICLLIFLVIGTVSTYFLEYSTGKVGAKVANRIRDSYTKKIMKLSQEERSRLSTGGIASSFNYDLKLVTDFIPSGMITMFKQTLMALIAMIYMLFVNWKLLLVSIGIMPICMVVVRMLRKKMSLGFKGSMEGITQSNEVVSEVVRYMPVVKSYNLADIMLNRVDVFYKKWLDSWILIHKVFSPMLMLNILINELPKVMCITIGSYMVLNNYVSISEVISFILLLDYVIEPLATLPDIITNISNTGIACQKVMDMMEAHEERSDGAKLQKRDDCSSVIRFDHVSFGYDKNKNVLKNISFELKRGEKIAFVGESGCGKSTLISLVCGYYDYDEGSAYMFDQDYKSLALTSIRDEIALVSQNVLIFPGTVAQNIALGSLKEHVSRDEIIAVAKAANAHEFISKLPNGYDTILSENGKNLSGGQRQMIAVARAFLKDCPLILLDEATSALDASAESVIEKSIRRLLKDRSAIIISHRPSTIKNADRILYMKDGCIKEEGKFETLYSSEASFRSLFQTRLGEES